MIDVLVTQHSRRSARRLHRALFGQSLINFQDDWKPETTVAPPSKISFRGKGAARARAPGGLSLARLSEQFSAAHDNTPSETRSSVAALDGHFSQEAVAVSDTALPATHTFSLEDTPRLSPSKALS